MATTPATAASWLQPFLNILKLEETHGFNDTAVVGGLDKFVQRWSQEMTGQANDVRLARRLTAASYAGLSVDDRRTWTERWLAILAAHPQQPAPTGEKKAVKKPNAKTPNANPAGVQVSQSQAAKPKETQAKTTAKPVRRDLRQPPGSLTVDEPVDRLRGVDTKLSARLNKLDVTTIRELLYLFPRRHLEYSQATKIADLEPGLECTVVATVWEAHEVSRGPKGQRKDTEAVLSDDTGNIRAVWFGQRYLARTLKPNSRVAVSGKTSVFNGQLVFQSPEYELLNSSQESIHTGRLVPVYPLTEGLTGRNVRRLAWQALQEWLGGVEELLPESLLTRTRLMPLRQAIQQAHYPDSPDSWAEARRRLAFDELVTLQLAVLSRRDEQQQDINGVPIHGGGEVLDGFLGSLPFDLTGAQKRCIGEILGDMERGTPPMNRLLQGEVGSGKTVVALAALLAVAAAGYQGAMMVPTELLAEQHFQTVTRLLSGLASPVKEDNLVSFYVEPLARPIAVGLLTGSTKAARKRELTKMAAAGSLDILIGTQALIQTGVSLPRLALAVADEQHRFGVLQRSALRQKSQETPHTLIMSATPIPRTLSLTLFGDLDISSLDELPAGRQEISTRWLPPERRRAAYGFVRKEVQAGRQGFIICPLVEESESIETKAATEEYQRLSQDVFPELRLGLLHGRMPSKEKDRVMRQYRDGELDLLISTPVVEVGIDVANATVMMIEGADRFGLAQLHQFRGRVGRGEHKSYCILLSDSPSEVAQERLSALERIHDGFKLAEVDLELRGPGDFFGTRQSGLPNLRMAKLSDRDLLELARTEAAQIKEEDPELSAPRHAPLAAQVARFLQFVTGEGS